MERVIFHIDVNSAFLSWSAAYRVHVLGEKTDLREIPSVVAGDKKRRQGVVLAKSIPAKKCGIQTGEPLFQAQNKCPNLAVVAPDYGLYVSASRHFIALLRQFTPLVEQYSIDEAWADMTGTGGLFGTPVAAADLMRRRICEELGFTVNIGISSNKLLAKVAGDFEKPNKVHTLFPWEIEKKLWQLPVRDMFMVGPATERKLRLAGICTIGQLAQAEPEFLRTLLHKPGIALWHAANGRADDKLVIEQPDNKSYGNSATLPADVCTAEAAHRALLGLCETVAARLRKDKKAARCVGVSMRSSSFETTGHQCTLACATNSTEELFRNACRIFDAHWDGKTPLRQLGVDTGKIEDAGFRQYDLFEAVSAERYERKAKLDNTVDDLRDKYGEGAIRRARYVGSEIVLTGGLDKERRTGITKPV
jgi:DNA polymerase-4